mmetsp:Transcript_28628/g.48723  ORF Transcript_28628/g.48723 Transcript_28628/m.48723 type:complete len:91 (+) Transcript_28628:235-507(+)
MHYIAEGNNLRFCKPTRSKITVFSIYLARRAQFFQDHRIYRIIQKEQHKITTTPSANAEQFSQIKRNRNRKLILQYRNHGEKERKIEENR